MSSPNNGRLRRRQKDLYPEKSCVIKAVFKAFKTASQKVALSEGNRSDKCLLKNCPEKVSNPITL
jgi:hypothetical protein